MITDGKLTSNEFMVYLGLLMLLRKNESTYYANVKFLAYLLTKKYPSDGNLDRNILHGIKGLLSNKMVSQDNCSLTDQNNSINPEEWILDLSKVKNNNEKKDKEYYTPIDECDIHKILLSNNTYYTRSITLLRFYAYVSSTIFKTGKHKGVGFTSLEEMSNVIGYSTKTISSYLKTLVDLEILYIYKSKDFIRFDTGEFVEISHTYGRYQDKNRIVQAGMVHEQEYGNKLKAKHQKIKKTSSNKNRGYAQKFNHLEKCIKETGEIPYTNKECKEIYSVMLKLNEQYTKDRPDRIKDLDVFSSFDFYECD